MNIPFIDLKAQYQSLKEEILPEANNIAYHFILYQKKGEL